MVKEFDKSNVDFLLIQPIGWTYLTGGVYFSLPLLNGFLNANQIKCQTIDLNLSISHKYNFNIIAKDVNLVCQSDNIDVLNGLYYKSENFMNFFVKDFNASWDIQSGFNYKSCNLSSSKSIMEHSRLPSPFDSFFKEFLIAKIISEKIPIIGFSITTPSQLLTTFICVRLLKDIKYDGKIILGGNMITRIGDELIKDWVFDLIDGFIVFQGEKSIVNYINAIKNNRNLNLIPNLIWKNKDGIHKNTIEYLKVNDFGRPNYIGCENGNYWGNNYLPILGSRGCYYGKCTFCSIPYSYGNNGFLGNDKHSNVLIDIVNGVENTGIKNFKFVDEALHPIILKKLSNELINNDIKIQFEGYARLDNFWNDKTLLKTLAKAGLKKVYIGLELISSDGRNLLNKSDSEKVINLLKGFSDNGIKIHLFTLFGYPGTGIDEAINTIEFCLENDKLIDTIDIFPFYYAKHTKVDLIDKSNLEDEDWAIEFNYSSKNKKVLTQSDVKILCDELEDVIWTEKPKWMHPIYRMHSPWQ